MLTTDRVQNTQKTTRKTAKTHALTGTELKQIRESIGYQPRDMRAALGIGSRRTYEDYEAGKRGIPDDVADKVKEVQRRDAEFMTSLPGLLAARLDRDFPNGIMSVMEVEDDG